ncbi:hypothetical protein RB195_000219 [Necator americanus]|uniref:Protein ST7 homolog n=1 Tax=Necator americanus TaxID=51031 RepID=A0ABR1D955_NECAM
MSLPLQRPLAISRDMVLNRVKSWLTWSWTYLWAFWFLLVIVLVYILRGPLKITESIENASSYFNNLTPKFYVALTGTSSLVSGIILIFEWWYFKNNAVDSVSDDGSDNEDPMENQKAIPECKVWRNPMALFRGAEYNRVKTVMDLDPLTYYDMNLSAQDHQSFFTCDEDVGRPDYDIMQIAWRERDSASRVNAAREALHINPNCAPALILLAEEQCETIVEAELMLRRALKAVDSSLGQSQSGQLIPHERSGDVYRQARRRDFHMQIYIRRRLAMCARKQGRLREAIKTFKDIIRDGSMSNILGVQENLIEACLEMQAYADVQALLVRYDGFDLREPRSAVLSYTSALLKARAVADKFVADISTRRGLSSAEATAIEAITRAIEFNPHVPLYLLEMRPMILPPEHYLKRGDSEAIAYAFFHIQHWKRIDGALQLLQYTWKGDFASRFSMSGYCYPYSPQLESADRELLPAWHEVSVFPKKESPVWSLLQTLTCLAVCTVALLVHHYPTSTFDAIHFAFSASVLCTQRLVSHFYHWIPENVIGLLASKPAQIVVENMDPHVLMSVIAPLDARKLVEALLGDLRQLSTEAKKKHNHVKEAAETGVVRVRNISTASGESNLLTNLRAASNELLHPLILACATRQAKLVQIALQSIQRLVQHRVLEASCANVVVTELWGLVEVECEELRVLQTVPPLVSADLLVTGNTLAKCIVMCFRMHFAKDPVVINAASAAVRQLVGCVFERVIQEDGVFNNAELTVVASSGGRPSPRSAPPTLRPCAADAYMLFKDLCLLINAKPSVWLIGIHEMTRTLGLELIESILKSSPGVFFRHPEFCDLLKSEVCPLVIKLFSPSLKTAHVSSQHPSSRSSSSQGLPADRPYFPIAMRLVRIILCLISLYHQLLPTECEIFLSSLMKFVDVDRRGWQRALSLEALHRVIARPDIIRWICENFDARSNSTKVLEHLSNSIFCVIQQCFIPSKMGSDIDVELDISQPKGSSGFYFSNVWHPYMEHLTAKKSLLLDSLERHEAGVIPEGYVVSRATSALADFVQAVSVTVDALSLQEGSTDNNNVAEAIFTSCQPNLLIASSLLLSASTDETVTDQLLCGLSTLMSVGCRLKMTSAALNCLYVLCCACLPSVNYLRSYAAYDAPKCDAPSGDLVFDSNSALHEVVASGTPCPSPIVAPDKWNDQVMLTSRNLQAARILLCSICAHATMMDELWYLCMLTCQHITWLLAIRPLSTGIFTREKTENDQQSNCANVITTAALSETPVLTSLLDKIACSSVSLSNESLLKAMESIMRLSDENVAVAATGRDCSLFPLAMLLRFSFLNLHRQNVFWSRVTTHFIKVCGHTTTTLREWSALALASIIKQAFKVKTDMNVAEQQQLTLSTLRSLCSVHHADVQRRQLDCLMALLQTDGAQMVSDMWYHVIHIVAAVVDKENSCDEALVRQGYLGLRLVAADFLQSLPFECISVLVEAVARYGKQTADHNISLSALTQLWTISDFVFRKSEVVGADTSEKVWLVLYTCLSELCVDARPSIRKSACQTLLQTVASHGHALRIATWNHMVWQIIMPLLDRVRVQTRSASTERASGALLMHHSRDTQQKQWTETCIHTLSAASKIFIAQRKALLLLEDFASAWEALLSYLEWAACYQNAELSLSAIKSFQEVLLGKVSAQTLDINTRERSSSVENSIEEVIPSLPLPQWIESWNTWQRISRGLARMRSDPTPEGKAAYVPGPSHLTTLLHIFPPLFEHVARHISVDELKAEQLPSVLESLVNVPVPSEQAPFVMQSAHSHMSPTQEAVCEAIRSIYNECISPGSPLREALADQIRQLLRFSAMALKNPTALRSSNITSSGQKDYREWALHWIVPFAETSLRMAVEFLTATVAYPEIIRSLVVVDVVKFLGEPLYLKYSCISPTTWKLAASSLMTVLRVFVPLARQHVEHFESLWPALCDTLEKFLFTPNVCPRLAADERKRDELTECQIVELVRSELLSHSSTLPPSMVQRLISILNRGSISQLDPTDVLASDSHAQRVELARTCFDALLSTSNEGNGRLGNVAVASLLQRCSQVMNDFVRDWSGTGDLRLPRGRVAEITSALQAVDSLIGRLARDPTQSELYSQLVSLYPSVVNVVVCARSDPTLESQLIVTLKSYQTLEGTSEEPTAGRFILSGNSVKVPDGLSKLSTPESIVRSLMEMSGPWSVVYHRPDMNRVFVGRDIFGRLSLVFTVDGDKIVISDVVQDSSLSAWHEIPFAQVSCIDTTNKSAVMHSYLPSYPEGILEPWANVFDSFSLKHEPMKDELIIVSRATEGPSSCDIPEEFLRRLVAATTDMLTEDLESTAVAFSGGVDSLLVAIALHLAYASERKIDLVNVAFIRDSKHQTVVTDRKRAVVAFTFLRTKYPNRRWRLILADITQEEMEKRRAEEIVKAAAPACSVLDESLACVLWFALRGIGKDYDSGESVVSHARTFFVGSGADELLAGYARHRTRFERDGAESIPEECETELRRLGSRNGGRDARVAAALGKELRAPFLNDDFVSWVNSLPMCIKCDLTLPRGKGEKKLLRQVLAELGAPYDAPKQAMQFGSGFVKMQNDKSLKGSDTSSILFEFQNHSGSGD